MKKILHKYIVRIMIGVFTAVLTILLFPSAVNATPISANNLTLSSQAGQVGTTFHLQAVTQIHPANASAQAGDVVWSHIGGNAPGIVVTPLGGVAVTGEGTVTVRGTIPAAVNGGTAVTRDFTLTFARGVFEATLHGLDALYVNVFTYGEVHFDLEDAELHAEIFEEDFRLFGLPPGLIADTPRRVSDTRVVVPISGAPTFAMGYSTLRVSPVIAGRNVIRGVQPLGVSPTEFNLPEIIRSAVVANQRATFDLNPANFALHRDIQVHILSNEQILRAVMYRNYPLIEGIDFSVIGEDIFRVHTHFLRQLPVGEWPLTFDMRQGASPQFSMEIIDTRITAPQEPRPANVLDTRLLGGDGDALIFIDGARPLQLSALNLAGGSGRIVPALQDGRASLWLRADILNDLGHRYPHATLEIHTRLGTLRFPAALLDILRDARLAVALERLDLDQVYVRITLTDMSNNAQLLSRVQQVFAGGQVLSPLVDVTIELIRRSDMQVFFTVLEFTRPIEWIQSIMPTTGIVRYGAFWFNPSPPRLEFAPHRPHGANEVLIRSIYTGVHGIINNGAIINDLAHDNWGFAHSSVAANTGLVQAQNGILAPHATITRAEFIQLLSFAMQLPSHRPMPEFYADVPANHWAFDPIARARFAGLLDGEVNFRPNAPITRQEMISITASAIMHSRRERAPIDKPLEHHIVDHHEIAAQHRFAVQTALNYEIFRGLPDNTFRPNIHATRLEAVAVIVELARVVGNLI
ncbi:MAG: S-layer homology domain-containing protein [Defluviitaleaceae bacterium]|nr:S-layer homology domain-containing protein [Defluviitaleaceae bacterium]MCL2275962.1 S-layer homology domain-containing protein [Defluviitaleaceae bacterium]